jgi:hydrogenase maturation protease
MKSVATDRVDLLIIGIGNPLRGDDSLGPRAAEMLSNHAHDRFTRVLSVHQLTPELAADLALARRAIFIDASAEDEPGRMRCTRIAPAAQDVPLSHYCSPEAVLMLAQSLYGHAPESWLIRIGAGSFELSSRLSPLVKHPLRRLVEELQKQIAIWRKSDA